MDSPSEERLIRLALDSLDGIGQLEFNLESRRLHVVHADGRAETATGCLEPLRFGVEVLASRPVEPNTSAAAPATDTERSSDAQRRAPSPLGPR